MTANNNDWVEIPPLDFACRIFRQWDKDWLLLTAGDFRSGRYNPMTVGWGFFGVMWGRPVAVAAVRPQRYTARFLQEFDTFTLTAYPESCRDALRWCGTHSGADGDKFAGCGLTPIAAERVDAPTVAQAELSIECRKLYTDRFSARKFLDKKLTAEIYPDDDFHELAYAEIVAIRGVRRYLA